MRAPTSSCSLATAPALQIALNRREDFLLSRVFGDVERNEAAIGQPDVSDDRAVGAVVEMKERTGLKLELGETRFTQLAELAKLVEEIGKPLESSPAAPRRCLRLGQPVTPVRAIAERRWWLLPPSLPSSRAARPGRLAAAPCQAALNAH